MTMSKVQYKWATIINESNKIGDWCHKPKSEYFDSDYYVIVREIKVLENPDGTKLYLGYGERMSLEEYRDKIINELTNEL